MTHDELLAKIKGSSPHWKALRAVVELHKPFNFETGPEEYISVCKHCQLGVVGDTYPCETINAIEEHLK